MGIGRDLARVRDRGAVVVDADRGAIEPLPFRRVRLPGARMALPEMRALEEAEPRAGDVDRLEAVDEAEDLGLRARAVEVAELLDEGQHRRADHDVVQHLGVVRDPRQVAGERGLRRRDRDQRRHLAALLLHRLGEEVAVIVAERIVRIDHRHLLAEVRRHPRRHGAHLALDVGDPGLRRPAVEPGGDGMALRADEVGNAELARPRRRAHHHVAEQRPVDEVHVPGRELLDDLGAALRIGAVVLEDDLDRAAVDPAALVQDLQRRLRGALVPAAVGGADAGAVKLEAEADRGGRLGLDEAGQGGGRRQRAARRQPLQNPAAPERPDPIRRHPAPPSSAPLRRAPGRTM